MGRIRRGGYIFTWWKGDHEPRHIHIRTAKGDKIGRLDLKTRRGLEGWTPTRFSASLMNSRKKGAYE